SGPGQVTCRAGQVRRPKTDLFRVLPSGQEEQESCIQRGGAARRQLFFSAQGLVAARGVCVPIVADTVGGRNAIRHHSRTATLRGRRDLSREKYEQFRSVALEGVVDKLAHKPHASRMIALQRVDAVDRDGVWTAVTGGGAG